MGVCGTFYRRVSVKVCRWKSMQEGLDVWMSSEGRGLGTEPSSSVCLVCQRLWAPSLSAPQKPSLEKGEGNKLEEREI